MLSGIFQDLTSLLFPNLCAGCTLTLNKGEQHICSTCLFKIPYTDHHLHLENALAKKFWGQLPVHTAAAMLYFGKPSRVQNIIHTLKYKNQPELGVKLGIMMAEKLAQAPFFRGIDLVVPVPLHKKKERSRGYNQSFCIAKGISIGLNIPVMANALIRTAATDTQTKKGREMRFENIETAFKVSKPGLLEGKHVLLVDDMITTGATIVACGNELLGADIKKLSIASAAFAE